MYRSFLFVTAASAAVLSLSVSADAQQLAALSPGSSVETVTVTAQRDFRPGALKSDIVKTEVIDTNQFSRLDAQNLNQAVDFNPGISVQTECSVCNAREITLNNLPGRYTTLMIDGVPLFSSLSSTYGLDSVSVRGTQSIEIARGAGASLIAPEALSGVVNIVTRRPEHLELEASAEVGNQGSRIFSGYIGGVLDNRWSASLTASYNKHDSVDNDGNGISEYTGYERALAGIALFGDLPYDIKAKLRLDYAYEDRGGGAMGDDYNAIESSTSGNPFNWSAGVHGSPSPDGWYAPDGSGFIPYDDGRGGHAEIVSTRRASIIGTIDGRFSANFDWRVAFGYARNVQHSFYEFSTYDGDGDQLYSELSARYHIDNAVITGGLNYRFEDLASRGHTDAGANNDGIDNYTYRTPGAFLQFYDTFFDSAVETNASVRYDDHNIFGAIVSPRFNLLWHHTDSLSSFFSIGRGYRAPTSFFEQDHGILDTTAIVRQINHPETSDNASYALNYVNDRLSATFSYNYNEIHHFAMLDPSAIDTFGNPITLFTEAAKPVTVQGIDFSGSYQLFPSTVVALGAEAFKYDFTPGTLVFSRPDWKLYSSVAWDYGAWDLFARVTVTGPQNLAKFYDYANTQQYNFDGTPKMNWSPVFATIDLKASYALNENWSVFAGADNVFDYRQTDHEGPLWIDSAGDLDTTHIWGPLQGRYVYGGVKVSL